MIFRLPNPVPYPVDPREISTFFSKYDILPMYGTTEESNHTFLNLLQTLTDYSPSFNSVMKDIKTYSFGLHINWADNQYPGLDLEVEPLAPDTQLGVSSWYLDYGIKLRDIKKLSNRIEHFLAVTGNAWLRIKRVTVGDTVRYYFTAPHYKHAAYILSRDVGERFVIVSKFLGDRHMMEKYPPAILRATQMDDDLRWVSTGQGVDEAIVHIVTDDWTEESSYYPRADLIAILDWLYVDIQSGRLNAKIASSELISKLLLAFQAQDPDTLPDDYVDDREVDDNGNIGGNSKSQFKRNMLMLKKLVTNISDYPSSTEGSASSIAGVEYPHSGVPPTVIPLELNRDTAHHQMQMDMACSIINQNAGWAPELTAARKASTGLGGNLLYDLFTMKDISTIQPKQIFYQDFWNGILHQIVQMENGPTEFLSFGIQYDSMIEALLERLSAKGNVSPGQALDSTISKVAQDAEDNNDANPGGSI